MRKIFIADAHLRKEEDECYRAMLSFLTSLQGTTETLFIMGDFFEFWIGYPDVPFKHYHPILRALQQLHACGTEIVYFEGNHDFHMGRFFTETLAARVFPGPTTMELAGRRTYLCHGDQANPADIPYRLLRGILHSPVTRWITHLLPPRAACAIAELMGRKGRQRLHIKGDNPDHRIILREFAHRRFAAGDDTVIAGHFHIPFTETVPGHPEKLLVSLGDWATRLCYAEMVDGVISQKSYTPHP